MTDYTYRVTIVVPETHMADANQLALVVGESVNDDRTFLSADWRDASDNAYALTSTVATPNLLAKMGTTLEAPPHAAEADLEAAGRARALLHIVTTSEAISAATGYPMTTAEAPVRAAPDAILAIVGLNGERAMTHAALAGVARTETGM